MKKNIFLSKLISLGLSLCPFVVYGGKIIKECPIYGTVKSLKDINIVKLKILRKDKIEYERLKEELEFIPQNTIKPDFKLCDIKGKDNFILAECNKGWPSKFLFYNYQVIAVVTHDYADQVLKVEKSYLVDGNKAFIFLKSNKGGTESFLFIKKPDSWSETRCSDKIGIIYPVKKNPIKINYKQVGEECKISINDCYPLEKITLSSCDNLDYITVYGPRNGKCYFRIHGKLADTDAVSCLQPMNKIFKINPKKIIVFNSESGESNLKGCFYEH